MRCCCSRCNNNKGNMKLSEYVNHIYDNRKDYDYISDKRLEYLKNFSEYYEEEFYSKIHTRDIKPPYKNSYKRRRKRK